MKTPWTLCAMLALSGLHPIVAQEVHFALDGALVVPHGGYFDEGYGPSVEGKSGAGFGIALDIRTRTPWSVRPRLDYLRFPTVTQVTPTGGSVPNTARDRRSCLSLGADVIYAFRGEPQGPYALAGISMQAWTRYEEWTVSQYNGNTLVDTYQDHRSSTDPVLAVDLGIGWAFTRHFAAEVRYGLGQADRSPAAVPAAYSSMPNQARSASVGTSALALHWTF